MLPVKRGMRFDKFRVLLLLMLIFPLFFQQIAFGLSQNSNELNESVFSIPTESSPLEDSQSSNFKFEAITSNPNSLDENKIENDMESMLHWAITNSDPEKLQEKAKEVKDLSEEELRVKRQHIRDLMEAMKMPSDSEMMSVSINDIKNNSMKTKDEVLRALNELSVLVEPIDNANNLHKMGGLIALKNILNHSEAEVRTMAVIVIGKAAQNNPTVQNQIIETEVLKDLMIMIHNPKSTTEEKAKIVYAISGCIRTNLPAQQAFYDLNGSDLLTQILTNGNSDIQILKKVVFLIADLADQSSKTDKKSNSNPQSSQDTDHERDSGSPGGIDQVIHALPGGMNPIMGGLPGGIESENDEGGFGLAMAKMITMGLGEEGKKKEGRGGGEGENNKKEETSNGGCVSIGGSHIDHLDKPMPVDVAGMDGPGDVSGFSFGSGVGEDSVPAELAGLVASAAAADMADSHGHSSDSSTSDMEKDKADTFASSANDHVTAVSLHADLSVLQSIVDLIHSRDDLDLHEKILITLTSLVNSGGKITRSLLVQECKLKHNLLEMQKKISLKRDKEVEFREYLDDIENLRKDLFALL